MNAAQICESPSIFVTTYHAYNCGRQFERGKWLQIDVFRNYDDFVSHCEALYNNEPDPEFMVTDFENFPRPWYSESGLPSESTFDCIKGYAELTDKDAFDAYISIFGHSNGYTDWNDLKSDFKDRYRGYWSNDTDFARDFADEIGLLDGIPESVKCYFNYEAFGRDLLSSDFCEHDGHYFWNY